MQRLYFILTITHVELSKPELLPKNDKGIPVKVNLGYKYGTITFYLNIYLKKGNLYLSK